VTVTRAISARRLAETRGGLRARTRVGGVPHAQSCFRVAGRRGGRRGLLVALVVAAGLAGPLSGEAQPLDPVQSEQLAVYEGRPIAQVRVLRLVEGAPDEEAEPLEERVEQLALNQIRLTEGQPFDPEVARRDIRNLTRLGRFGTIRLSTTLLENGSVVITYLVSERQIISDVQAVGNERISDREIADVVGLLAGTPVDPLRLSRASRDIELLYRAKGFHDVRVTVDEQQLEENGIVLFKINEHDRLRIESIQFDGNRSVASRRLRSSIRTKTAGIFSRGRLDDDLLADDIAAIRALYLDRGFLDVRVSREITRAPNNREAVVTFVIDEGPVYTFRDVLVYYPQYRREERYPTRKLAEAAAGPNEGVFTEGREFVVYEYGTFTPEQVAGLLPVKTGEVFSQSKIANAVESLREAYGKLGHLTDRTQFGDDAVLIQSSTLRDTTRPEVDLLLLILEADRYLTGEVIVVGNTETMQKVVDREVDARPSRPLDGSALRQSEENVNRTRLFEPGSVRFTPQQPDPRDPRYRDVLVEVRETNTASLSVGGAVDADLGVSGRLVYSQANFDIADPPRSLEEFFSNRSFRGAGQTFTVSLQPGTVQQLYSVGFTEPHLLDSDYSLSTSVFYRDFQFDEFDEERLGWRVGLGRQFGRQWTGSVSFRLEQVELSDIEPSEPVDIFAVADANVITGVGVNFVRDTLDSFNRPTEGSRTSVGVEQVGLLGGDFDFTVLEGNYRRYFTLAEDVIGRRTVLSLDLRGGYIPQGQDEVPVYERFYLGGRSFRGFGFREVSPTSVRNDTGGPSDDPVGGTWLFFAGLQLEQPVYRDVVSVVGFLDTGTVLEDFGFEDYRVSVGVGLRLYLPLSPFPLSLDFGFPLAREASDDRRVFSFFIDVPF